jgi:hypothetical protein
VITLREFVCKECGHKVVVHPRLPLDYTPNICCECYEHGQPKRRDAEARIFNKAVEIMRLCGEVTDMTKDCQHGFSSQALCPVCQHFGKIAAAEAAEREQRDFSTIVDASRPRTNPGAPDEASSSG